MKDRVVLLSRRTMPWHMGLWWRFCRGLCYLWLLVCYRVRTYGKHHLPKNGPILYVANHQSFLDPMVVGAVISRPFFVMARKTLFKHPVFGWLLRSLSTIAVDQESVGDKGAIKACIEVLDNGQPLLLFPEGARSLDGTVQAFSRGTMLLIRRAKPVVVPVAIEGAFAAWPRGGRLRKTGRIVVAAGEPIPAQQLLAMDADEALNTLQERVEAMRLELAAKLARHHV